MKRLTLVLAVLAVVACTSFVTLPTSATMAPASDLQLVAGGGDSVVMSLCGYRVTITRRCKAFPNYCCK